MVNAPSDRPAPEDLLDEVLTAYLKAAEAGQAPDREEWLARYPDLAAGLREFFRDQDRLDRFAGPLRPAGRAARVTVGPGSLDLTLPQGLGPAAGADPRSFGDYEPLQLIAEGGMGAVYKARHRTLGHLVALKVLLAGRFARPSDLQRFRNEAETIAALAHPNIVPIYEVGERDGRLFLSLRLLEGGTLADHLARYGGDPRAAAALVIPVAQAVQHAHQRGVLHRDLKPSNILLDADGRPYVADFGLARRLEGDSGLTQTGAILGTPTYMAPEQTVAGRNALTTAADVYGLGGVLYALLTGGPPFQGGDVFDTMAQVRERAPESPRRRNPRVDRDLATICLKCLEKEPQRRYATAQDLADDLGRYLRHEPTRARPAGPARRLAKWVRRRPALAALVLASALFLVTLVAGVLVHNVQLREAAKQASDNEVAARRQQQLAADHYRQARDTINRMLARLEGRGLADVPRLKELSQQQLEDALGFYQRTFDALDAPDPEVRRDTAVAYRRAADIQQTLGKGQAAADNYRRAIRLLEELPAEEREAAANQALLAGCYTNLALAEQDRQRWDEAERNFRAARDIKERLARAHPDDPAQRVGLAESAHHLGVLYQLMNKPGEAEPQYDRAVAWHAALVHDHPEVPAYRSALAQDYINLASIYMGTDRRAAAGDVCEKAAALLFPLVQKEPDSSEYSLALAAAYVNWSHFLRGDRRPQDALRALDRAVELTEAALRREPNLGTARVRGYNAHGARAQLHQSQRHWAEAVKDWDRVVELDGQPQPWIRRALRAVVLARAGEHARAAAEVTALEGKPEVTAEGILELARASALSVEPARSDARLSSGERDELAERYAARAVALLRRLKEQGWFKSLADLLNLATDPDFKSLRGRDDFKKLLAPAGGDRPE
jgi:tetratricopeptide (TPR) repeat protein